ncbi:gamma-glutamyl-gamma-aminobutyrate hydrolase family protein [uncultured Rhodospira sp.]|uniref:glutamine amidotransferase-related protein n=1 Tax=uncultured Rhodospira sp. TaxID=1936189 RepID=UPI00260A1D91|nr:gamma-glutamyl-gamma-aminobutyrate hydrolase family protein [uncultured Rhodospira sp.]
MPDPVLIVVHQPHSDPGRVGAMLRARGHALDRRCPLHGDALPEDLSGYAGTVVFGGPMSANDDHLPGLRDELRLIDRALARDHPLLGICLGGQMMARVLGGRVARRPDARVEIGYYPIQGTGEGRRMGLFDGEMGVYQWHQEGFDLPVGARLLARGGDYPNQAFAVGRNGYGLQFHPEVTHEMMERWMSKAGHMLTWPGARDAAAHRAGRARHDAALGRWLGRFLDRWLTRDR